MAIKLHSLSRNHLRGALIFASVAGIGAATLMRDRLSHELLVAAAWDTAVLFFILSVLQTTSRFDESQMTRKVRHRAPSSLLVGCTAFCAALFGIYALMLLVTASAETPSEKLLHLGVAILTTALSWSLVHLLFALEYARVYYGPGVDGAPVGGLDFPGGHQPNYVDFLYFSFVIGVACQTAEVATLTRSMRGIVLAQGLVAFVFNTVILAATVNVAAGLIAPG